jgi:hypothetical protein
MDARGCSQVVAGTRRPGPKSLRRMSASPMPHSALRGHARGRDLLRTASRNALPGLVCARWSKFVNAPRRRQPRGQQGELAMWYFGSAQKANFYPFFFLSGSAIPA